MTINVPVPEQMGQLRSIWKESFQDEDDDLDAFYRWGFAPRRSRCLMDNQEVLAALYWFDCSCQGAQFAYLYGVATAAKHRKRGFCRLLMEQTHRDLKRAGYAGAILVPASESLFTMYESMGYRMATTIREYFCTAAEIPAELTKLDGLTYAHRRRELLPAGGIVQEDASMDYLQTDCQLYGGPDFLLAADLSGDGFRAEELLGNQNAAPSILKALGVSSGQFRSPGEGRPFSMYVPLTPDCPIPTYLGLTFE